MKYKKSLVVLATLLLLFVVPVLGADTMTYSGLTNAQILRSDATLTYTSGNATTVNITLTVKDPSGNTVVSQRTEANTSSYAFDFESLVSGNYTYQAIGYNTTNGAIDTGAWRSFLVTGCGTIDYSLWGVLLLLFIVGIVFFAYNGFLNGKVSSIAVFIILLTIAVVIIANFSLTALRSLC